MLSRRLLHTRSSIPLSPSVFLFRPFSTTQPALRSLSRAPSLADISPDNVQAFDARQKDFREKTAAAQRAKEQAESQSSVDHLDARDRTSSSSSSSVTGSLGLGSLTSHKTGDAATAAAQQPSGVKGALSSLVYGTPEGRQLDKELELSFSQVLARGKYVHSIVFHKVKPDKVDEYVDLIGNWYPKMASMPQNKVNLVGSWRTEVGDCDTFGGSIHGRTCLMPC